MRDWTLPGPDALTLDGKDVAGFIGVSEDKLREMVKAGQFPPPLHSHGKRPVWSGLDVAAWLYLAGRGGGVGIQIPEENG